YNVPFNPRADNPYLPEEYAAYKRWFFDFTKQRGIPSANLEDVVPLSAWGQFVGGPDYKHFRGEGHRRTADALNAAFHQLLVDTKDVDGGSAR
ncbi:MAG: hypothetical protein ACREBE_00855, partial [bacterium]